MKPGSLFLPFLTCASLVLSGCGNRQVVDEAMAAGKTADDFPTATADVFKGMDGGIELTPEEIKGRNTWMLWTGGNERFWDVMAGRGYGLIDLLKNVDSRNRDQRFENMGLMNEPGFKAADAPDEFGLYLDVPVETEPAGVDPEVYGRSSGVIGLRLFPNPDFDETARKRWNAERYYNEPSYYQDPDLVRPYRVGMSCAICHVAPHPLYPPADLNQPAWTNLSGTIGNQYFRNHGVFGADLKPDNLLYHLLKSAKPGTVDTSIVATDNNNNPNIINSIYQVAARLTVATEQRVGPGALLIPADGGELRKVPHVLVDGADSIGVQGALNRVFVNIGTFSEEWMRCHNPIIGLRKQRPFRIEVAQKNSVYWQVTERRSINLAKYLVRASGRMPLKDAPGGAQHLTEDANILDRGKLVFAENCVACHSSKRPTDGVDRPPERFEEWARSESFLAWSRDEVMKPDFLEDNYLSTDARYPVTLLGTNPARALQNNAIPGQIWDEFSSFKYKETPSVGEFEAYDPFADKTWKFKMPAGGPGFYRVPTLVAIWAGAPFLHNNGLGEYNGDPSVDGRMKAFNDAITKMCWPEQRLGPATIARTTQPTWLMFPAAYVPVLIEGIVPGARLFLKMPWLLPLLMLLVGAIIYRLARARHGHATRIMFRLCGGAAIVFALLLLPLNYFAAGKLGDVKIGPFPAGTPVSLLGNLDPHAPPTQTLAALLKMNRVLKRISRENLSDAEARKLFETEAAPDLLKLSKSPDWVEDRGHYFAAGLSDEDKRALIEFLKTF